MLAVLKNLHLVVGIVSLIIKVLGIVAVVQVALMGQQENISLGRSVETLIQCTIPFSEIQGKCNAVFYLYYIFQLPITYPSAEEEIGRATLGFSRRCCAICYDNTPAQAEWAGKRAWASGREDEEDAWKQWPAASGTNRAVYMDSWWRLGLHPLFAWYVIGHFDLDFCLVHTPRNDIRSIHPCCTKGLEKFCVYILIKWHLLLKCDLFPLAYSLSTTGYFLIPPKSIKTD